MTPSAHRQQPQSAYGIRGSHLGPGYMPMANNHPGTPFRQPLGNLDRKTAGYLHEPIGDEQRSPYGRHELSLICGGGQTSLVLEGNP
jgi:hypothetical protein